MLRSLGMMRQLARSKGQLPDFSVLRALLFWVDEFPARQHHRRETDYLFPLARKRCPDLAPVPQRLDHDHGHSKKFIPSLQHDTPQYLEHMALEERDVLPAAQHSLTTEGWARLHAIFEAGRDPLTLPNPDAPAPIGLGHSAPAALRLLQPAPCAPGAGAQTGSAR